MYNTIKRLYDTGRLTADGLSAAIARGWITQEQYEAITGGQEEE